VLISQCALGEEAVDAPVRCRICRRRQICVCVCREPPVTICLRRPAADVRRSRSSVLCSGVADPLLRLGGAIGAVAVRQPGLRAACSTASSVTGCSRQHARTR